MLTFLTGMYLAAREHLPVSQLFLFGLYGLAGGLFAAVGGVHLFRMVGPNRVKLPKRDPVQEAIRKRIRVDAGDELRSLYQGPGSQALGGAMQEVESVIRALNAVPSDTGIHALTRVLLADITHSLHESVDKMLKLQDCSDDQRFQDCLYAWADLFTRYQKVVRATADVHRALKLSPTAHAGNRYVMWREYDAQFIQALKRIQHMDGCEILIGQFRLVGWGDDVRLALPKE